MTNLKRAHNELFRRSADECFSSLEALTEHCQREKALSLDRWHAPGRLEVRPHERSLQLAVGDDGAFLLNHWSFGQLCSLARVSKDTVNRLMPETAAQVFRETLPGGNKPLQILTMDEQVRSVHGASYTRLFNADLLEMVQDVACNFTPPQQAAGSDGTGLYCGEQDMFVFLIDPLGWAEIGDQAFAPGFFVWNSEVGKRSLGIETFWFQAVCQNHIVWDAVETVEFTRKHTAKIGDSLEEIRNILQSLINKRDERRDGFSRVIRKAMEKSLGTDADEVLELLGKSGISSKLGKRALEVAKEQGRFTLFAVVDALTRLAGECLYAGERMQADQKASSLLALAA